MKEEASEPRSYIVKTTDGSELKCHRVYSAEAFKKEKKINGRRWKLVDSNKESLSTQRGILKRSVYLQLSSPESPRAPAELCAPVPCYKYRVNKHFSFFLRRITRVKSKGKNCRNPDGEWVSNLVDFSLFVWGKFKEFFLCFNCSLFYGTLNFPRLYISYCPPCFNLLLCKTCWHQEMRSLFRFIIPLLCHFTI